MVKMILPLPGIIIINTTGDFDIYIIIFQPLIKKRFIQFL